MPATKAEAKFAVNIESNAGSVAPGVASELEKLRQKIQGSQDSIKGMSGALRSLRGDTAAVKSAKADLAAKLDAEKSKVSSATLELLKHGTTYDKLTTQTKKMSTAAKGQAGPIENLKSRWDALGDSFGKGNSQLAIGIGIMGLAVAAAVGLAKSIYNVAASVVSFVIGSANMLRGLQLMREGAAGSEENAKRLGDQVEVLARQVSTPREELNKLSIELMRTRLSGQAIVDTFSAVSRTADAMGDSVGKQLQDILTRCQRVKRLQINPRELQGTGLKFTDIAANLAKQMHVGIKEAQAALFEGRVKLDDGAKAIRATVEKTFGRINAGKLLDLNVQAEKFKERLQALTKDINLEPMLKAMSALASNFSEGTIAGNGLKTIVTGMGNEFAKLVGNTLPLLKPVLLEIIISGLEMGIAYFKAKRAFEGAFGKDTVSSLGVVKGILAAIQLVTQGITASMEVLTAQIKLLARVKDIGAAAGGGLAGGLDVARKGVGAAAAALGVDAVTAIEDKLQIHSPSKVFARVGEQTGAGFSEGIEKSSGGAQSSASSMVSAGGGGGGGGGVTLNGGIHVSVIMPPGAAASGQSTAAQLSGATFRAQLTKAFVDALLTLGIPTQKAPATT